MAKGDKVKRIINDEFDERLAVMALTYTLGQLGMQRAEAITDDEIAAMEGNGLMTQDFVQSLARTARRIATECDFCNDVVPYIVKELKYLAK